MKKYRPIFAALIGLLFYTITDILVWQRVFETNQLWEFANPYHTGWIASLAGYGMLGIVTMWGDWKDCLFFLISLFIGAFSGLEDLLYYVLDRKPIPDALPWLENNPMIHTSSRTGLIGSVLFWIALLAILYFFLFIWKNTRQRYY